MRLVAGSAIWAAFAGAVCAQTPGAARLGIYHWAGAPAHSMAQGVTAIADLGGHMARLAFSARYYRDYNIAQNCYPNFTLAAAAQEPDIRQAFDDPSIDVVMLTTYDGTTFGDCQTPNFLNPAFFTSANTAAVAQEYNDFTLYLYRTYQHTNKRFIISNWESDNAVYCGQAYSYAVDPSFRQTCRSQYQANYGIASPEDAMQGLKLWFNARAQGIVDGRQRALAEGLGGKRVYLAPEFNIVRALHDNGLPSVLYDVLPFAMFDYVSYSAWESLNAADPPAALWADLNTIQDVVGSNAIIVGESGYLRRPGSTEDVTESSRIISTALAWGVAYVVQWQLYDTDSQETFGLYDLAGNPTPLHDWFQLQFEQINAVGPSGSTIPATPRTRSQPN